MPLASRGYRWIWTVWGLKTLDVPGKTREAIEHALEYGNQGFLGGKFSEFGG